MRTKAFEHIYRHCAYLHEFAHAWLNYNTSMEQNWTMNNYLFELGIDLASNLVLDVVNVGASWTRKPKAIWSFLYTEDVRASWTEHQHYSQMLKTRTCTLSETTILSPKQFPRKNDNSAARKFRDPYTRFSAQYTRFSTNS